MKQQVYPGGASADRLCEEMRLRAVNGYEEEEEVHLASLYLFPFLTG